MKGLNARLGAGIAGIALAAAGVLPASATEGYFALGYSPAQRGVAGAGVAAPGSEATSTAINPASVAGMGRELSFGVDLFMPDRGFTATGTFFVPAQSLRSDSNIFAVPNFAYNRPLANGAVLNFAAYGNGGMNTTYPAGLVGCGSVYCGGPAGVDLSQLFLSATYAQKSGAISWGIAPTVAVQAFKAKGLGAFSAISTDVAHLTDQGYDMSYGIGLRAGIQAEVMPGLRFGLTGQSSFNMSKFDKYAGLFENGGDFDIPASVTAGIAWAARPDLNVMLDYQRIFYSGVGAIGNAGNAGPLGAPGGAGFGWDDVDVVKLGVEWKQSDKMTWRAGYAHVSNPIGPEDVTLNIIAPGVVQDHISLGGSYRPDDRNRIDFAVVHAFNNSVTGPETTPGGPTPGSISIDMNQLELSVGWVHTF